jgi:hypothetical protein
MKKFRLPRKIKKSISNGFYLYPADSTGGRIWARPHKNQEDYDALKSGVVENMSKKWLKK